MNSSFRKPFEQLLLSSVRDAGRYLHDHFGGQQAYSLKGNQSSIVTLLDVASEKLIIDRIRSRYPDHSIIAEESGYMQGTTPFTWIIDPLDGTSNYAAGIPWYGVQVAILEHAVPTMSVMYLPEADATYFAVENEGAFLNGKPVRCTFESRMDQLLFAYGMDASRQEKRSKRAAEILRLLVQHARNVRSTNCLLDFCYTVDGRLGGMVNFNTHIWDIAPAWLALRESGGLLTDPEGREIQFDLDPDCIHRSYEIIGAKREFVPEIARLIASARSVT